MMLLREQSPENLSHLEPSINGLQETLSCHLPFSSGFLILESQCLDFVAPFLGCMKAGRVPLRPRIMQNICFLTDNLRGGGNAGTQHQQ